MPIYAFEAKGIQSYILEGGKLRDIAGASEIVHRLAEIGEQDLVGAVLAQIENGAKIVFSRRAGGAFTVYADDAAPLRRLRALFTLAVAQRAPGLTYIDALIESGGFAEGLKALPAALHAARARPAVDLPGLSPAVLAAPRTGRAGVARARRRGGEMVDAATQAKRACLDALRARREPAGAEARFLPPHLRGRAIFPIGFAEDEKEGPDADETQGGGAAPRVFPMLRGRSTIALVHADGNRLGATLIGMIGALHAAKDDAAAAAFLFDFSRTVAESTEQAVQQAVENAIWAAEDDTGGTRVLPLRPVVLGGDDLGLIVRGDLALPFIEEYLVAFRNLTGKSLVAFKDRHAKAADPALRDAAKLVPRGLSAGAGIAFVNKNHPFIAAHDLAEELAKHAKGAAKNAPDREQQAGHDIVVPPSLLSFHRVTTALGSSWNEVLTHDLQTVEGGRSLRLTLAPYEVRVQSDPEARFPLLSDLLALSQSFDGAEVPVGPIRQTVGHLHTAPHEARRIYMRWCEVMDRTQARRQAFATYAEHLGKLGADARDLGCVPDSAPSSRATPLLDALCVRAVTRGDADD